MGRFSKLCFCVGMYQIYLPLYNLAWSVYQTDYQEMSLSDRLKMKYGIGKQALVTGASAGIGECFVNDLAQAGFDVTMVSRSKERLDQAAARVKTNAKLETQAVDLTNATTSQLEELFQNKNYSIIVNNAGVALGSHIMNYDPAKMQNEIQLNIFGFTRITRAAMINFSEDRSSQKGIVQLASIASHLVLPGFSLYGGSKRFNRELALNIALQNEQRGSLKHIDTIVIKPHLVTTAMSKMNQDRESCLPSEVSQGALSNLGKGLTQIWGSVKHQFICNTYTQLFMAQAFAPIIVKDMMDQQAKDPNFFN